MLIAIERSRTVSAPAFSSSPFRCTPTFPDCSWLTVKSYDLQWGQVRNTVGKYNTVQPVAKVKQTNSIFESQSIRVAAERTPFFNAPLPAGGQESQKRLQQQWAVLYTDMQRAELFGT